MNILILTTDYPYPPASGGAIRVHGIVEGLRKAGHTLTLVCFHQGILTPLPEGIRVLTAPPPSRSKFQRLRHLLTTRQPDIAQRFRSSEFETILYTLLQNETFDIVQFEGIETVCFQPIVAELQPSAKRVFDTFNAEYELQRTIFNIDRQQPKRWHTALYSFLQVGRIERYERAMCQLADAVIAVSEEDAALLRSFRDDKAVTVVPNGIWTERYQEGSTSPFSHAKNIVFTGKMDYRPNVDAMLWFTESILPKLTDVHLTIVGQQPHPRLAHLNTHPAITITGRVDSVLPYLHHATVYIAPLRMGSGTRLKLLEAMACGCAIVATQTASAGLSDDARQAMLITDDADAFAQHIRTLLENATQRQTLGYDAKNCVQSAYDWSVLIPRLLTVYQEVSAHG
jgi:glycosyltransferase involved in cell wall biosynthesis